MSRTQLGLGLGLTNKLAAGGGGDISVYYGALNQGTYFDFSQNNWANMWTTSSKTTNVSATNDPCGYVAAPNSAWDIDQAVSSDRPLAYSVGGGTGLYFGLDALERWLENVSNPGGTGTNTQSCFGVRYYNYGAGPQTDGQFWSNANSPYAAIDRDSNEITAAYTSSWRPYAVSPYTLTTVGWTTFLMWGTQGANTLNCSFNGVTQTIASPFPFSAVRAMTNFRIGHSTRGQNMVISRIFMHTPGAGEDPISVSDLADVATWLEAAS